MTKHPVKKADKPAAGKSPGAGTLRISERASVFRVPPALKDEKVQKAQKISVLTFSDIPEAGYIENSSKAITLSKETIDKHDKYFLRPLDVILTAAGTIGRVSIVPESFKGRWLPAQNIFIIRMKEAGLENSVTLAMYLKSSAGQKMLDKLKTGKTILRINVKDFNAVRIPEFNSNAKKQAQTAFAKELKLFEQIEEIRSSIAQLRAEYKAED